MQSITLNTIGYCNLLWAQRKTPSIYAHLNTLTSNAHAKSSTRWSNLRTTAYCWVMDVQFSQRSTRHHGYLQCNSLSRGSWKTTHSLIKVHISHLPSLVNAFGKNDEIHHISHKTTWNCSCKALFRRDVSSHFLQRGSVLPANPSSCWNTVLHNVQHSSQCPCASSYLWYIGIDARVRIRTYIACYKRETKLRRCVSQAWARWRDGEGIEWVTLVKLLNTPFTYTKTSFM